MLKNYFKTIIRSVINNKVPASINLLGLTLGISCSIVLFTLITYWLSFNTQERNYDSIYRLVHSSHFQEEEQFTPGVPATLPGAFRNEFPEIEKSTFLSVIDDGDIKVDSKAEGIKFFKEDGIAFAEPSFFDIFSREIIAGSNPSILHEPNKAFISQSIASKYYPNRNPIGELLSLNGDMEFEVVGVISDPVKTTDFPFQFIVSYETVRKQYEQDGWFSIAAVDQFYVKSNNPELISSIEERFPAFLDRNTDNFRQDRYFFQPMKDMHYDLRFNTYAGNVLAIENVWALSFVAVFLLIISSINYVNLETALVLKRSKEIGIRKVLGSNRKQLIIKIFGEAVLLTFCALVVSLLIAHLSFFKLNDFLETHLTIDFGNVYFILTLIGILISVSLLAGIYPALVASKYNPIRALKAKIIEPSSKYGFTIRHTLVAVQFFIAQLFITVTIVVFYQVNYLNDKDLGFKKEAIISLQIPLGESTQKKVLLKNKLENISSVKNASLASTNPIASGSFDTNYSLNGGDDGLTFTELKRVDANYLDVFDIKLIAGENIRASDSVRGYLVNEAFVRAEKLTPQEIIGQNLSIYEMEAPIVGVVQNFHTRNLRYEIRPLAMCTLLEEQQLISTKVDGINFKNTLQEIENTWKEVYPNHPFDHSFFDSYVGNFYKAEQKLSTIINIFSLIVIGISCLGLFGLVTFIANQKAKEVGIRKVLGASISSIIILFNKQFIKLILLAFIGSAPIVWYVMDQWLVQFSYRIELEPHMFGLGLGLTMLFVILTVSYKSIKAATVNPVESIYNE